MGQVALEPLRLNEPSSTVVEGNHFALSSPRLSRSDLVTQCSLRLQIPRLSFT